MQNTSGLQEFRVVFQFQLLQFNIFKTLVMYHAAPIDDYIFNELSKYEVFVTAHGYDTFETKPNSFMNKKLLSELFVNASLLKSAARKKALLSYQALSENILATKTPSLIRKRLHELKVKIAIEYCDDMKNVLCPYMMKTQIIAITNQLRHTLTNFPEGSGFTIGKEVDTVLPTLITAANLSSAKVNPNDACMLTKDVLISNPLYVPHYYQIMKVEFTLQESNIGSNSKFKYSQKEAFTYYLEILQYLTVVTRFLVAHHQQTSKDLQTSTSIIADIKKLHTEISHLSDPENTLIVKNFLEMKVELMYIKKILALQYAAARFASTNNKISIAKVNVELAKFFNTSVITNHFNSHFWPCVSYFNLPVSDMKYYNNSKINFSIPFDFLENYLLTISEAEKNYIVGEEMNIELQMDEVLEESKIYSASQSEICVQTQLAYLELSYEIVQLKNFYYKLLVKTQVFDVSIQSQALSFEATYFELWLYYRA